MTTYNQALTVNCTTTKTMSRSTIWARTLSATCATVKSLARGKLYLKTFTLVSATVKTVTKGYVYAKTLSIVKSSTATFKRTILKPLGISVGSTGTYKKKLSKTIVLATIGLFGFSRKSTFKRTISLVEATSPRINKLLQRIMSHVSPSSGNLTMSKQKIIHRSLIVVASHTISLTLALQRFGTWVKKNIFNTTTKGGTDR